MHRTAPACRDAKTRMQKSTAALPALLASLLFSAAPLSLSAPALAAPATATRANVDDGLAIHGFDPLSYLEGKPTEGRKDFEFTHEGATYRFASRTHLETFKSDPARFEPAYKGWCAYAMAKGEKVDIDPRSYKVIAGKTFLFYKGLFGDTLKKWNQDENELHKKADAKWKELN